MGPPHHFREHGSEHQMIFSGEDPPESAANARGVAPGSLRQSNPQQLQIFWEGLA